MSLTLAILCGGPSGERGISLNSARSLLDHFSSLDLKIKVVYFNPDNQPYTISQAQLYSNTPSDFDFKLQQTGIPLNEAELIHELKTVDLVFPAIHGAFGEDGHLQAFLEANQIPFAGPSAQTCRAMFDKYEVATRLESAGFDRIPSLKIDSDSQEQQEKINSFFEKHIRRGAVVKPVQGGSSLDVYAVTTPQEAMVRARAIISRYACGSALLEPFCRGREFTVIVLDDPNGVPVALVPSEIEKEDTETIFDYRGKYLPTNRVFRHCPPRFLPEETRKIRDLATKVFRLFGMRDFARLDGWLLQDGRTVFTDLNPISGMEQNSFIFQQAAVAGMRHGELLVHILKRACGRLGLRVPERPQRRGRRHAVKVLFGGNTAERQVSVMSGTNVWLKLQSSHLFEPHPYLMGKDRRVWHLPYAFALNHTVEEIEAMCRKGRHAQPCPKILERIQEALQIEADEEMTFVPESISLDEFLDECRAEGSFVFLGLHGGDGENGTIQALLDERGLAYNGSGPQGSRLCMDKYATGEAVRAMGLSHVRSAEKRMVELNPQLAEDETVCLGFWQELTSLLGGAPLIIKPSTDGCSAGIVKMNAACDLAKYVTLLEEQRPYIPAGTFDRQPEPVEMPASKEGPFLFEKYIETDLIRTEGTQLYYEERSGWIELTIGIREQGGRYHALNPSITVAGGQVLSLEEKFQGGTGVNITPPPEDIVPASMLADIRRLMAQVAEALHIRSYARLDFFLNRRSGQIIVIEANTLPGLTPSTVIYHQALAENPPQDPLGFLESIIQDAILDRTP